MLRGVDGRPTYTAAEKLFYSAIADFSAMLTSDETTQTFSTMMRAITKSIHLTSGGPMTNRSWIQKTYNAIRKFARCQWSPLAVPLPFASTYKQQQILGCKRPRQV